MIGTELGHFRILAKLAQGGMGEIYHAHDLHLDREVALKLLPPALAGDTDRRTDFEQEARLVAALNHPNIVTIYSIEEVAGHYFITMELIDGTPLTSLIPAGGIPLPHYFDLAIPLADAVSAAHERGITHNDLKPDNIMISREGRLKVLDFGLARLKRPESDPGLDDTTTRSGPSRITGTVPFMSPEQIQGHPLDHRSDIFSLGIILYEMATGLRPFRGPTVADVIAAILRDTSPPVDEINPKLPRQLGRIIRHCLEKDIRRRLQSALDLRNELESLRIEIGAGARSEVKPSIAVLPFADMSPERDQGYFCDGIAEEITNALSKLSGLMVASRTSAFQFKGKALDSREIGQQLGVRALLAGSVRKAGDRLRITAELTSAADGYNLWSESYDREMKDVFAIQEEIARHIVQTLEVTMNPGEQQAIGAHPTRDVAAYDLYLRGREFFYQYTRRGIEFALKMFSRAIEIDPRYARAFAGIADCRAFLYMYGGSAEENRQEADAASRKALELDADSADAHAARGVALTINGRHDEAAAEFERAIQLDPRLFEAYYHYARACFARGKLERAIELYEKASMARPEDYQSPLLVAQSYADLGLAAEAEAARRRGIALAAARVEMHPEDSRALYMAANGLVALGEGERGLDLARQALAIDPAEPMVLYNVACVQALAGRAEEAMASIEQSVRTGLNQLDWLKNDSNLDLLRSDPRFQALVRYLEERARGST